MRIALASGGNLLRRVSHVLLSDPRIELIGARHRQGADRRMVALDDLSKFDTVVAQNLESPEAKEALQRGIPIVVADHLPGQSVPNVTDGADVRGLAGALAITVQQDAPGAAVEIGVTTDGRQLNHGSLVAFPQPVGPLHTRLEDGLAVAPHNGDFAAITVSTVGHEASITRGVVDDKAFVAAVCLASAVLASHSTPHRHHAGALGADYVREAIKAGLSVASRVV